MTEPTAEQAAHRFKLATKIDALARGTQVICDGLPKADDATVVAALEKLQDEVADTLELARSIAAEVSDV